MIRESVFSDICSQQYILLYRDYRKKSIINIIKRKNNFNKLKKTTKYRIISPVFAYIFINVYICQNSLSILSALCIGNASLVVNVHSSLIGVMPKA